ncbi:single-stranded DNA-binding protein [Campylobacter helveticus]|uniref:single-stranded DNA-binding protein n=1 Tax=Campylobacter helveticus TaxID=28898 RepID=UPI0022EA1B36|nr:single-stranded DNA-binding protein [Campylobacter helveticus]
MNEVRLLGYLGRNFEAEYTKSGKCYARNSLAITKKWKNERGDEESKTTWIPIVLFGKAAETAYIHFPKGSQFLCSGVLQSNDYVDKDGNKRTALSVVVSKFYFLNSKKEMINQAKEQNAPKQETPKEPEISYEDTQMEFDSEQAEIPF